MDKEFSEFQDTVREANMTLYVALECAAYVLRRARELPLDQRVGMIERLKGLISVTQDNR